MNVATAKQTTNNRHNMRNITPDRLREILDYHPDTGVFTWRLKIARGVVVGNVAGSTRSSEYVRIVIDRCNYSAHRLAWLYMTGEWPKNQIDHINGVKTDNRFTNLREATISENARNRGRPKKGAARGLKGVTFRASRGKWEAQIMPHGRSIFLGMFDNAEAAHAAYCAAAEKYYGSFAKRSEINLLDENDK